MEAHSISFRVTGEAITSQARDLVLAGRQMDALKFLGTSLDGISMEQCFSVLDGSSKLVTRDSDVLLVDDADPDYREDLQNAFAGRMKRGEHWYRPCAIVTDTGEKDERAGIRWRGTSAHSSAVSSAMAAGFFRKHERSPEGYEIEAGRVVHYSDQPMTDIIEYVDGAFGLSHPDINLKRMPLCVILERTVEPFSGVKPPRDLLDAVAQSMKAGLMDVRGHSSYYPNHTRTPEAPPPPRLDSATIELRDAEAERARDAFKAEIERIGEEVRRRAGPIDGDGWMDISGDTKTYRVPRLPFEAWALSREGAPGLVDWDPVSPPGLKLQNDNRNHSDWMIAAGLPLDAMYRSWGEETDADLVEAAFRAMNQLQRERLNFEHTLLAGSGVAAGPAYVARRGRTDMPRAGSVVVLPNASPEWLETVQGAAAVIVERGGAMAHLVSVLRPGGLPVVLMKGACGKIVDGVQVTVDCSNAGIKLGRFRAAEPDETIDNSTTSKP